MAIHLINDDIFMTGAQFICHQTNCVAVGQASGIARLIFEKYPYADTYKDRIGKSIPGTIDVFGDGLFYRHIINMNAQFYPGKANINPQGEDTAANRKKWFYQCLLKIAEIEDLKSVAFPDHIGCALAGGDWEWYEQKLIKFAAYVGITHKAEVLIYKRNLNEI